MPDAIATQVLNQLFYDLPVDELVRILDEYGEEQFAGQIAAAIAGWLLHWLNRESGGLGLVIGPLIARGLSYLAADEPGRLAGEAETLRRLAGSVEGHRYHYLRVDPHRNLAPLVDIGFEGKGGKYLVLPPDYKGDLPEGYTPVRPATYNTMTLLRSILASLSEKDEQAGNEQVKQVKIYPLSKADNPPAQRLLDIGIGQRTTSRDLVQNARQAVA